MHLSHKLESLHRALEDAHVVINGFNKFLDLACTRGPHQPVTSEMEKIAQETCSALDTMVLKNPEIMEDIIRANSAKNSPPCKNDSFEDLDFSWNIDDDILMEDGGFRPATADLQPKQKRHGKNILHYVSRWVDSYLLHNFHFMQRQLSLCLDVRLKQDYIDIACAIERRFSRIFCESKKAGRSQIISTVMAPETFDLWLSFQYFRNSSLRFERSWNIQTGFSYWEHSVMLDVANIPVFLTKDYYWYEYQVNNEITKLVEYYRMYAFRMEFEYEVEYKTFTIVASLRKEKFSTINRIWEECS